MFTSMVGYIWMPNNEKFWDSYLSKQQIHAEKKKSKTQVTAMLK